MINVSSYQFRKENGIHDILKDAMARLGIEKYYVNKKKNIDIFDTEQYWVSFLEDGNNEKAYVEIVYKNDVAHVKVEWTNTKEAESPLSEGAIKELIINYELEIVKYEAELELIRAGVEPPLQVIEIIKAQRGEIVKVAKRMQQKRKEQVLLLNNLPKKVQIPQHNFWCDEIIVAMSCGMPEAHMKILEEKDAGNYSFSLCDAGSIAAEKAPLYLQRWCKILNKLIRKNKGLFENTVYHETIMDRATARAVEAGIPFDQIGTPTPNELEELIDEMLDED